MMQVRAPSYTAVPASQGGTAAGSSEDPPSSLFYALYSALGGWLIEPPAAHNAAAEAKASPAAEPAQSFSQVLEHMGSWALRAAMLNTQLCLPVNVWQAPSDSSSHPLYDPDDPAAALTAAPAVTSSSATTGSSGVPIDPMQPPSCGSNSSRSLAAESAVSCGGQDALKDVGDTGKQQAAGLGSKLPTSSSSSSLDQYQRATPPPQAPHPLPTDSSAAADICGSTSTGNTDSSSSDPEVAEELERLRREVSCLRTSLGTLYLTANSLREENQRLRSADGGEELLSDALQQLLAEKNALQQEVSKLARQNQALQELLDYTAAAAGAAPTANDVPWGCCVDISCTASAAVAAAAAADQVDSMYDLQQLQQHSQQHHHQDDDQDQEHCCGYWLATPTGSQSTHSAASGRSSPAGSCSSHSGDSVSVAFPAAAEAHKGFVADWQGSLILAAGAAAAAVAAEAAAAAAAAAEQASAGEVGQVHVAEVAAGMAAIELSDPGMYESWDEMGSDQLLMAAAEERTTAACSM